MRKHKFAGYGQREIHYDEDGSPNGRKKIEKSGEYSVEQINAMVSEVARKKGITKRNDEGLFIGNGDNKDFSNFGRIVLHLKDQEWFLPFVKTWVLYADEETLST
ncbi:MAG: hypothetical protein K2N90_05270 [Lachnospiraceae bacterium]|nr:hypothetical protein [Lachnospiraceae bacterium]